MADEADKDKPILKLDLIAFPTDQITIGQLRQRQPQLFTEKGIFGPARKGYSARGQIDAFTAMESERRLAQKAFAAAAGQPDPHPDVDRMEERRYLNEEYVAYGLSSGPQQTNQLIRDIESSAARQAGRKR
jgi:hypothetical protein